jgi:serine/threonine-protein kinase PpkA
MIMKRSVLGLFLILFALLALHTATAAAAPDTPASAHLRVPLLMEGKKSLYQRVLTRPGAQLQPQPGSAQGATPVPALSQLYVYGRRTVGGTDWLEVGPGSRGQIGGWVEEAQTLPWKQQMTLAFTNPAGRDRTLLFKDRESVVDLLKSPDPAQAVAPLRKSIAAGLPDPKIISIEPETYIDINKQFYLLPILQAQEIDTGRGFRARVLEVASVTQRKDERSPAEQKAAQTPQQEALRSFSAAIVFVIDTTISMNPYIQRTREAVARVAGAVEKAGLEDQVRFGLVAFRSNTKAVPKLEYVSKVFADPNKVKTVKEFLSRVADVREAKVSSAKFDEDPYAGILTAAKDINWQRFGGRYIVLITDAGAIDGTDPLSTTGLGAAEVRSALKDLQGALMVLHLKTPEGKQDHAYAEKQYREASFNPVVNKPLYYPVEGGAVGPFGAAVDTLATDIVHQVESAARGELAPGSAGASAPASLAATPDKTSSDVQAQMQKDTQLLGRAMQLAYLGRTQGTAAPPLFRAWLSDRDFAQPQKATTEVRVLLTKNQLSDVSQVVSAILKAGEESQITSTADFFDLIRSAAANIARDPNALKNPNATRLGELGLLGEYLDDLPYRSDVMALSRDVWTSWSTQEQQEFLDSLRRKLRLYSVFHDDVDRWVKLAPGADDGDAVYPVPIEALP